MQSRTFTVRKSITCGEQWTFTVGKGMSYIYRAAVNVSSLKEHELCGEHVIVEGVEASTLV